MGRSHHLFVPSVTQKKSHVVKFEAFTKKNSDLPFPGKMKVFEAALVSAILYGSEAWLSESAIKTATPMYMACIRSLLGVRKTTASDLCLVESNLPPLLQRIKVSQQRCIEKLINERTDIPDDPFMHAMGLARDANAPCARYILSLEQFAPEDTRRQLNERIEQSQRTKYITYRTLMNPQLSLHEMYTDTSVKEHERLAVTRLRLSSHNMAIEKGRWARQPRERRICVCGEVQDEPHVLGICPLTAPVRAKYPQINFEMPAFFDVEPTQVMTKVCYDLVKNFV